MVLARSEGCLGRRTSIEEGAYDPRLFVGRGEQLAVVDQILQGLPGNDDVVHLQIRSERGMGRSWLLGEILRRAAESGFGTLQFDMRPFSRGPQGVTVPFFKSLIDQLRDGYGFQTSDDQIVRDILDGEFYIKTAAFIEARARERPIVVGLDHIEGPQDTALEDVNRFVWEWLAHLPYVFVVVAGDNRVESFYQWVMRRVGGVQTLSLDPFNSEEVAQLCTRVGMQADAGRVNGLSQGIPVLAQLYTTGMSEAGIYASGMEFLTNMLADGMERKVSKYLLEFLSILPTFSDDLLEFVWRHVINTTDTDSDQYFNILWMKHLMRQVGVVKWSDQRIAYVMDPGWKRWINVNFRQLSLTRYVKFHKKAWEYYDQLCQRFPDNPELWQQQLVYHSQGCLGGRVK